MLIFITITILSFSLFFWISKRANRLNKNNADYFFFSNQLATLPLAMTIFATMLGSGTLLGTAQIAYENGWMVVFYPIGTLLGCFAIAFGFGRKIRSIGVTTVPGIFFKAYKSKTIKNIAALLSIISLYAILVGQAIAIKSFLVSIGITNLVIFFGFWFILITYTSIGGFKAVVDTDVAQASFIIVTLVIVLLSIDWDNTLPKNIEIYSNNLEDSQIISWLILPFCFMLIGQDMAQRCFASKSNNSMMLAAILAGVLLMFCCIVAIFFGILATSMSLVIPKGGNALLYTIGKLAPKWAVSLFHVAVIMAITSTSDSLLCALSLNVTNDLDFMQSLSYEKKMTYAKIINFVIGITVFIVSLACCNIINVLMIAYEITISALFVPFIFGIYAKNPNTNAAYASIAIGVMIFCLCRIFNIQNYSVIISLFGSLLGYCSVYVISIYRKSYHI